MKATLRPSEERGHADHGWLDTRHTFSFAHYHDPRHMGFRALRVINDDVVKPGTGFPTHGHRDMEIISYVVDGALAHEDSTGGKEISRRGDIQVMSAGTGIRHSEYNGDDHEDVRLLQIWILPERGGLPPAYAQATIPEADKRNRLTPLAGPAGSGAALPINQDAVAYAALLEAGASIRHQVAAGRGIWVQMVNGAVTANGVPLATGDGLAIEDAAQVDINAAEESEFLLFDLA